MLRLKPYQEIEIGHKKPNVAILIELVDKISQLIKLKVTLHN
jgi:hypothetical protein